MGKNPSIKSLLSNAAFERMAPKGYKSEKNEQLEPSSINDPTSRTNKSTLQVDHTEQYNKSTQQIDTTNQPNESTYKVDPTSQPNKQTPKTDPTDRPNEETQQKDSTKGDHKSNIKPDQLDAGTDKSPQADSRDKLEDQYLYKDNTDSDNIPPETKPDKSTSKVDPTKRPPKATQQNDTTSRPQKPTQQAEPTNQPDKPTTKTDITKSPDKPTQRSETTSQPDKTTPQANLTSRPIKSTGHSDPSSRPVESIGQVDPTQQVDTSKRQVKSTSQPNELIPQNDPTSRPGKKTIHDTIENSKSEPKINLIMGEVKCLKSNQQKKIYEYLLGQGDHVTKKPHIAKVTGIPLDSVKRILKLFKDRGLIDHKPVIIKGHGRCTQITILNENADGTSRPIKSTQQNDTTTRLVEEHSKIDRQNNNIYLSKENKILELSDDDIAFYWPKLKETGFGKHQLHQIIDRLKKVEKSVDSILVSLDYFEYELDQGNLKDKNGNQIENPCAYIFNALARHGYYRKPPGYISPAQQAAIDAEEVLKAEKAAEKRKMDIEFETWKLKLSDEKKEELRRKQPGGNDLNDRYLKTCFFNERK